MRPQRYGDVHLGVFQTHFPPRAHRAFFISTSTESALRKLFTCSDLLLVPGHSDITSSPAPFAAASSSSAARTYAAAGPLRSSGRVAKYSAASEDEVGGEDDFGLDRKRREVKGTKRAGAMRSEGRALPGSLTKHARGPAWRGLRRRPASGRRYVRVTGQEYEAGTIKRQRWTLWVKRSERKVREKEVKGTQWSGGERFEGLGRLGVNSVPPRPLHPPTWQASRPVPCPRLMPSSPSKQQTRAPCSSSPCIADVLPRAARNSTIKTIVCRGAELPEEASRMQ